VIEVNNGNFTRVDRNKWEPKYLTQEELRMKYDAHLPLKLYLPERWEQILPLLKLMFGEDSKVLPSFCPLSKVLLTKTREMETNLKDILHYWNFFLNK